MMQSRFLRPALSVAAALAALSSWPVHAAGSVEVVYVEPEKFADIGRSAFDREHTLKSMTEFLKALGRELPDGQTLSLEVTDFDLAGRILPFGHSGDLRVLGGAADWPHMTLRYTLQAEGRILKQGEAQLSDINYLYALRGRDQGDMPYEKRMVRTWFETTFIAH